MTTYILKRILMMIPTLFVISLVIFLVLNIAPGQPGNTTVSEDGTQSASSAEARESHRIFKEQFNLDKPILLNTRIWLGTDEVLDQIRQLADFALPACAEGVSAPSMKGPEAPTCILAKDKPSSGDIIVIQEEVEDWGSYIIPQLMEIASSETQRLDIRRQAIVRLSVNGKRRLVGAYSDSITDEQRAFNEEVSAENQEIEGWVASPDADIPTVDALVEAKWQPWFAEHAERWTYSSLRKLEIVFLDTRFAKYWSNLIRLDFGISHVDKRPVMEKIIEKLPYTLSMNVVSILIAYFLSIPLGVWSAYNQNSASDQILTVILFALYSLPSFFVGVLLLYWFTIGEPFSWFPTGSFVGTFPDWYQPANHIQSSDDMTVLEYLFSAAYHMVLPLVCMSYGALASLSRYARTGLLDVIRADYIRTARAKGIAEPMVIMKHAVRNGMIPILTLLGTLLPSLIGGSVVIEFMFNIPGMGLYMYDSIFARDYNVIMGVLLISTLLTLFGLLLSDISYAIVDPRISFK